MFCVVEDGRLTGYSEESVPTKWLGRSCTPVKAKEDDRDLGCQRRFALGGRMVRGRSILRIRPKSPVSGDALNVPYAAFLVFLEHSSLYLGGCYACSLFDIVFGCTAAVYPIVMAAVESEKRPSNMHTLPNWYVPGSGEERPLLLRPTVWSSGDHDCAEHNDMLRHSVPSATETTRFDTAGYYVPERGYADMVVSLYNSMNHIAPRRVVDYTSGVNPGGILLGYGVPYKYPLSKWVSFVVTDPGPDDDTMDVVYALRGTAPANHILRLAGCPFFTTYKFAGDPTTRLLTLGGGLTTPIEMLGGMPFSEGPSRAKANTGLIELATGRRCVAYSKTPLLIESPNGLVSQGFYGPGYKFVTDVKGRRLLARRPWGSLETSFGMRDFSGLTSIEMRDTRVAKLPFRLTVFPGGKVIFGWGRQDYTSLPSYGDQGYSFNRESDGSWRCTHSLSPVVRQKARAIGKLGACYLCGLADSGTMKIAISRERESAAPFLSVSRYRDDKNWCCEDCYARGRDTSRLGPCCSEPSVVASTQPSVAECYRAGCAAEVIAGRRDFCEQCAVRIRARAAFASIVGVGILTEQQALTSLGTMLSCNQLPSTMQHE